MYVAVPLAPPALVQPAHDWYDPACCAGTDCFPIEVKITPGGYRLPSGMTVPFRSPRIKQSQDMRFHYCGHPQISLMRCLYVPNIGQ